MSRSLVAVPVQRRLARWRRPVPHFAAGGTVNTRAQQEQPLAVAREAARRGHAQAATERGRPSPDRPPASRIMPHLREAGNQPSQASQGGHRYVSSPRRHRESRAPTTSATARRDFAHPPSDPHVRRECELDRQPETGDGFDCRRDETWLAGCMPQAA